MWFWLCPKCKHQNWGSNSGKEQHCSCCDYIRPSFNEIRKAAKLKKKHPFYDRVMEMRKQGMSYRKIGLELGYSYQSIYNIVNKK